MKKAAVYIMANRKRGTLYTGITSNLAKRVYEHRQGICERFTAKYGCKTLVFVEYHDSMEFAIASEKQIKAGSLKKKLSLIERTIQIGKTYFTLCYNQQ